jgi:hypothetical protein
MQHVWLDAFLGEVEGGTSGHLGLMAQDDLSLLARAWCEGSILPEAHDDHNPKHQALLKRNESTPRTFTASIYASVTTQCSRHMTTFP